MLLMNYARVEQLWSFLLQINYSSTAEEPICASFVHYMSPDNELLRFL